MRGFKQSRCATRILLDWLYRPEKTMLQAPAASPLSARRESTTGRLEVLDRKEYMGLRLGYRFNGPARIATFIFDPRRWAGVPMDHVVCRKNKETLPRPRLMGAYGLAIQICKILKMFFFFSLIRNWTWLENTSRSS